MARLPDDIKKARELTLSQSQYHLEDGTLFYVAKDKTLRIIPPLAGRRDLFDEAHSSVFSGHLREAKIHSQLAKHYWWSGMRVDIQGWCASCLTCATRGYSKAHRVPLTPIPVAGPFDRVGVDVIQFPRSRSGKNYAIVFVDYLTKWLEVFATKDQTALTIAKLFVQQIVSRHGVPTQLLSDRGPAFLSHLLTEVCSLLGVKKVNTTAYHPQTDGLVERFNRTLTAMLSKKVDASGKDWDEHLPFVLFAYRASIQESTQESPFYLLYGRDPKLPSALGLEREPTRQDVDLCTYSTEVTQRLQKAWDLAQASVKDAQQKQKFFYDRNTKPPHFCVGQRVFVYMPGARQGKAYKFARPFHGPFRIVSVCETGVSVRPVDKPDGDSIRVAFNRLRTCPESISDAFWPPRATTETRPLLDTDAENTRPSSSVWEGRLRNKVS